MMPNMEIAYQMLLARLDRAGTQPPEALAVYLRKRLDSAVTQLESAGIVLADTPQDLMLIVDLAAWQEQNRDNSSGTPNWLRTQIRNRWIQQREAEAE